MGKRRHRALNAAGFHNPRGRGQNVRHEAWCTKHRRPAYTRANAKAAIREVGGSGMREVLCTSYANLYHIHCLPDEVRSGEMTLDEYNSEKDQSDEVSPICPDDPGATLSEVFSG